MGGTQKVTLKVALEDLRGALVNKKEGIREMKTTDMSKKKIILAQGKGRFIRID